MVTKVAKFQDITLGFDGSASVRFMKGVVDDDGSPLGGSEPHRLTIQPNVTDIAEAVQVSNAAILDQLGFEVPNGDTLATYVQGIVLAHRADATIAANTKAWCDAVEAARLARIVDEEERARQQAEADAAQEQAAQDAATARQAEVQAMIDTAVTAALAGQKDAT